jgi:copper chaperone CopZ
MATLQVKTNLRCGACVNAIRPAFDAEPGVTRWAADVTTPEKLLTVEGDGITVPRIRELLQSKGYQVVSEPVVADGPLLSLNVPLPKSVSEPKTSYFPLLLILLYLLGGCALFEVAAGSFDAPRAMRHFMAGFFLVFSFFKLLNLSAFADSYRSYDIVARAWPAYGFLYPLIELGLGAAYLANVLPTLTNGITLAVMGISTIGVVQTLMARRKIRCACLGTVFNLPMSSVTLVEDLLMVAMAAAMLLG